MDRLATVGHTEAIPVLRVRVELHPRRDIDRRGAQLPSKGAEGIFGESHLTHEQHTEQRSTQRRRGHLRGSSTPTLATIALTTVGAVVVGALCVAALRFCSLAGLRSWKWRELPMSGVRMSWTKPSLPSLPLRSLRPLLLLRLLRLRLRLLRWLLLLRRQTVTGGEADVASEWLYEILAEG